MGDKNDKIWKASCIVIVIITAVWVTCKLSGAVLPDMAFRAMGLLEMAALFVLGYTTVKKKKG